MTEGCPAQDSSPRIDSDRGTGPGGIGERRAAARGVVGQRGDSGRPLAPAPAAVKSPGGVVRTLASPKILGP